MFARSERFEFDLRAREVRAKDKAATIARRGLVVAMPPAAGGPVLNQSFFSDFRISAFGSLAGAPGAALSAGWP